MGAIDDRLGELGLTLPAPMAGPGGVRLPFETVRIHGDLAYVTTADDNAGGVCDITTVETCYGSANTSATQASGVGYYRFKKDWFGAASASIGLQKITITDPTTPTQGVPQSSLINSSFFLRVGYRF